MAMKERFVQKGGFGFRRAATPSHSPAIHIHHWAEAQLNTPETQ